MQAADSGRPSRLGFTVVLVKVSRNRFRPRFTNPGGIENTVNITVPESVGFDYLIYDVNAEDNDTAVRSACFIASGFYIYQKSFGFHGLCFLYINDFRYYLLSINFVQLQIKFENYLDMCSSFAC